MKVFEPLDAQYARTACLVHEYAYFKNRTLAGASA